MNIEYIKNLLVRKWYHIVIALLCIHIFVYLNLSAFIDPIDLKDGGYFPLLSELLKTKFGYHCFLTLIISPYLFVLLVFSLEVYTHFFYNEDGLQYKIAKQDLVIEFLDGEGKRAKYTNNLTFKILKGTLQEYPFAIFGDGTISDINVTPGSIKKESTENNEKHFITSFENVAKKGDLVNQVMTCFYNNSFLNPTEFFVTKRVTPNDVFTLTLVFPDNRKWQTYSAFKIIGHQRIHSSIQPTAIDYNGKKALKFETKRVNRFEVYRIEWTW